MKMKFKKIFSNFALSIIILEFKFNFFNSFYRIIRTLSIIILEFKYYYGINSVKKEGTLSIIILEFKFSSMFVICYMLYL